MVLAGGEAVRPARNDAVTKLSRLSLSDGHVDGVEAARRRVDAIAATGTEDDERGRADDGLRTDGFEEGFLASLAGAAFAGLFLGAAGSLGLGSAGFGAGGAELSRSAWPGANMGPLKVSRS